MKGQWKPFWNDDYDPISLITKFWCFISCCYSVQISSVSFNYTGFLKKAKI